MRKSIIMLTAVVIGYPVMGYAQLSGGLGGAVNGTVGAGRSSVGSTLGGSASGEVSGIGSAAREGGSAINTTRRGVTRSADTKGRYAVDKTRDTTERTKAAGQQSIRKADGTAAHVSQKATTGSAAGSVRASGEAAPLSSVGTDAGVATSHSGVAATNTSHGSASAGSVAGSGTVVAHQRGATVSSGRSATVDPH